MARSSLARAARDHRAAIVPLRRCYRFIAGAVAHSIPRVGAAATNMNGSDGGGVVNGGDEQA